MKTKMWYVHTIELPLCKEKWKCEPFRKVNINRKYHIKNKVTSKDRLNSKRQTSQVLAHIQILVYNVCRCAYRWSVGGCSHETRSPCEDKKRYLRHGRKAVEYVRQTWNQKGCCRWVGGKTQGQDRQEWGRRGEGWTNKTNFICNAITSRLLWTLIKWKWTYEKYHFLMSKVGGYYN